MQYKSEPFPGTNFSPDNDFLQVYHVHQNQTATSNVSQSSKLYHNISFLTTYLALDATGMKMELFHLANAGKEEKATRYS